MDQVRQTARAAASRETVTRALAGTTVRVLPEDFVIVTLPQKGPGWTDIIGRAVLERTLALTADGQAVALVVPQALQAELLRRAPQVRLQPERRVIVLDLPDGPPAPGILAAVAADLERDDCACRLFSGARGLIIVAPAERAGRLAARLEQRVHAARTRVQGDQVAQA